MLKVTKKHQKYYLDLPESYQSSLDGNIDRHTTTKNNKETVYGLLVGVENVTAV